MFLCPFGSNGHVNVLTTEFLEGKKKQRLASGKWKIYAKNSGYLVLLSSGSKLWTLHHHVCTSGVVEGSNVDRD